MKRPALHIVHEPRPWPFMSSDPRMVPASADPCECKLELTLAELENNKCATCGKALT